MIDLNDAHAQAAPPLRFDLDAIVARLREDAATWVPQSFPEWAQARATSGGLPTFKGAAPRKNGSCVIALKGRACRRLVRS